MGDASACFVARLGPLHDILQVRRWFNGCTEDNSTIPQSLFDDEVHESSRRYAKLGSECLEVAFCCLICFDTE